MRKLILLAAALFPVALSGQTCNSWGGKGLSSNSKTRILNLFVNIIYDVTTNDPCANQDTAPWPSAYSEGINNEAIPDYLLDFMDTVYVAGNSHGTFTRIYGESSFDSLQITGDFMVVNIPESYIDDQNEFNRYGIKSSVVRYINENGGVQTIYGHDKISQYGENDVGFINMLVRNITREYGDFNQGEGMSGEIFRSLSLIFGTTPYPCSHGTYQCIGSGRGLSENPTNILVHELSHRLFGSNYFHTSGGNHRGGYAESSPFLTIQGGYGLMGAANSSLVCCNGYERWRMHWKHPDACGYISARDIQNAQSVASDICKADGNRTFLLRDFVTYGDAIRIKLPYKDSTTSTNQYIWLENHQMMDGKLDFLQHSNTHSCRPQHAAGVYAYYQIGRDVLSGSSGEVWDSYNKDNLRIIPAEGFWDYSMHDDNYNLQCVDWTHYNFNIRRDTENPFCGSSDLEKFLFPAADDDAISVSMEKEMRRKVYYNALGDTVHDNSLAFLGDQRDAFNGHAKLGMATNPSTCNAKTFYNKMNESSFSTMQSCNSELNTQTTYLTGLGIEITQSGSNYIVSVRWDDYDITNSANWTGRIALKEQANLKTGNTITLRQNRTVGKNTRDTETGYFAGRTMLVCEGGSLFTQDTATVVSITENSIIRLDSASSYVVGNNSVLRVENGELVARKGSSLTVNGSGRIEIGPQGTATISNTALLGGQSKIIVENGGKLVIDKAVLTSNVMWQGIEMCDGATVEMRNGARIEYAHNAIRTMVGDDWDHAGGTLKLDSCTFSNCRRAMEFKNCPPNANSYIKRVAFSVDNNNRFADNGTSFYAHISAWVSSLPWIRGCSFENLTGDMSGYGIYALNSTVNVTKHLYMPYTNSPYRICTFTGFSEAVSASNDASAGLTVQYAGFTNNIYGIRAAGTSTTSLRFNEINLGASTTSSTRYGIHVTSANAPYIGFNSIVKQLSAGNRVSGTGIYLNGCGSGVFNVQHNTIGYMRIGLSTVGNNSGLIIKCNSLTNNTTGVSTTERIYSPQGSSSASAGNTFTGNFLDLSYSGNYGYTYYYSGTAPTKANMGSGVITLISASADGCSGGGGQPTKGGDGTQDNAPLGDLQQYLNYKGTAASATSIAERQSLESRMAELSAKALGRLASGTEAWKTDSLKMWYGAIDYPYAKYALAELHTVCGETAKADSVMTALPDMMSLSEDGYDEYASYLPYYSLYRTLSLSGRSWTEMTDDETQSLKMIAEQGFGKAKARARFILCFFGVECYTDGDDTQQQEDTEAVGNAMPAHHSTEAEDGDREEYSAARVYPNPTDGTFTIVADDIRTVEVFNQMGQRVLADRSGSRTINADGLPAGIYFLKVETATATKYGKLMKK